MSDSFPPVYVVDDAVSVRKSAEGPIRSAAHEFLKRCRSEVPGCLLLDVKLPGQSGLDLQRELAKAGAQILIVFLTGHGDVPVSVQAIKSGAVEFLTKPIDPEALQAAIRQAIARRDKAPHRPRKAARNGSDELIGSSSAFKAMVNRLAIVAPTDSTVLILGETGTGKELAARAIHARSRRSSRPMVSVNCAALQPSLIASELFGHERGSFTGALHQRLGRFELAEGGTIFLDEIGDLPSEIQIALLRVLQEREFERVGGNKSIRVDVRVIAASNRDLKAAIAAGSFRSDLFYRLNVFPIHIPPLRERRADIPVLVEHFLRAHGSTGGKQIRGMDEKTLEMLRTYSWPGNIRELQNVIERWAVVSDSQEISIDESWFPCDEPRTATADGEQAPDGRIDLRAHVEAVERTLIGRAMTLVGGNQSEAARRLGLSRGALLERLRRYRMRTAASAPPRAVDDWPAASDRFQAAGRP